MTYLPPINVPITAYATIYRVLDIILSRAKQAKLPYADITFGVGAVISAQKVLCNHPPTLQKYHHPFGGNHFYERSVQYSRNYCK